MAQVAELTDYQISHVYFRPRDKDGKLIRPVVEGEGWKPISYREIVCGPLREKGYSEAYIQARWQEFLQANPGLAEYADQRGLGAETDNGSSG